MNNKHQENGAALTGPLIFTLPVFSLNLGWLDGTGWVAVFAETRDWERDRLQSAQRLLEEPEPETCPEAWSARQLLQCGPSSAD
jgi:hypothetical protein